MIEEPLIFGNDRPFMLIPSDDLAFVVRFLADRHIDIDQSPGGPALHKLTFRALDGKSARHLMRQMIRASAAPLPSTQ